MAWAERIHASCVAVGRRGVLILGASGAGKSRLALALVDRGAMLVADDVCELIQVGDGLRAAAPARLAGVLELRGQGLIRLPFRLSVLVHLAVEAAQASPDRMPEPAVFAFAGGHAPLLKIATYDEIAAQAIEQALMRLPTHLTSTPGRVEAR
jgi:HPr kinase/phosphorylase